MPKVYIQSQGCQMNVYDSDRLADLLQKDCQLERVSVPEQADVLLLNTCAIREKSQEKVFSQLGRWNQLKKHNPQLVIGVGGCVASQEGEAILDRAPYVDVVFGPQTLHRVPALLQKNQQHRGIASDENVAGEIIEKSKNVPFADNTITAIDITFPEIEKFDALPAPVVHAPEAFVSIMEGCSKYCSFCVVPYTRGEEYSRPFASIMHEVHQLVEQGVREIHFLGQNVNAYLAEDVNSRSIDLVDLIRATAAIDNVARIRFTTSHPLEMSDRLIACYADTPKLVSHLHLPIQSGSDKILRAMKRGYTADYYRSIVAKLYKARSDLVMSSDFIVGFPGESEADFQQTLAIVKEINFDTSFSFLYSPRPGTPAARLVDTTPIAEKKQRLARLQEQLQLQTRAHAMAMEGRVENVLVSDFSKRSLETLQGRTENNRIAHVESSDPMLIGQMVKARIDEVLPNCLRASLVHS